MQLGPVDRPQQAEGETVQGHVKWFDPGRGYGFIVVEGGKDILLHANVLRAFGRSSVGDGAEVLVIVQETGRGRQAVEILQISTSDDDAPRTGFDFDQGVDLMTLTLLPARIKWFDRNKGFGFANLFGDSEDVFVHSEILRRSGFAELQPGEAVCLKVIRGARGLLAVDLRSWDTSARGEL